MDATHFDRIAKVFADRRLSRRQSLVQGGAGLAAGALAAAGLAAHGRDRAAAQDATPPAGTAGEKIQYLFVQSFQSGSVAPKAGEDGTYTLTLEQGLGQTLFFSDRPERIVGAAPTPAFLAGLGFAPDNPPNAALVVEPAPGQTEIAVLELTNPVYDEATHTATYDVTVLAEWERTLGVGFREVPTDLATLAASFGPAHLFIDDCDNGQIWCNKGNDYPPKGEFHNQPMCWNYLRCIPCEPYFHVQPNECATYYYWGARCNDTFADCNQSCRPQNSSGWGNTC